MANDEKKNDHECHNELQFAQLQYNHCNDLCYYPFIK